MTRIGVVTERKPDETRVGLTPTAVRELTGAGHQVLVEAGAGARSHLGDDEYRAAGASVVPGSATVWGDAEIICKVKEPQPDEFPFLRPGLVLFTYLHLASYPAVALALVESGVTAIGYETVEAADGSLPLLTPMSEIAGRLAPQAGMHFLEHSAGGRGVLLGGAPGVAPAKVTVLGAGIAGSNAAQVALGVGAEVTVVDLNVGRLRDLEHRMGGRLTTAYSDTDTIAELVVRSDLLIGAVLSPGARAPRLVSEAMVRTMPAGAVIVDISIDQGGCFETSHETRHADPVYAVGDVLHYAVGNVPAAVPRTATLALVHVTLPYVRALADEGVDGAMARIAGLAKGVNVRDGQVVNATVAQALEVRAP